MEIVAQAKSFLAVPFNKTLVLLLLIAAVYSLAFVPTFAPVAPQQYGQQQGCNSTLVAHFFYLPSCPHCKDQMPVNQKLAEGFPCTVWEYHDLDDPSERAQLISLEQRFATEQIKTPTTVIGKAVIVGFDPGETPQLLREALSSSGMPSQNASTANSTSREISIPFIGKIRASDYSLLPLSILLGLIDGFNPCAMWVLVYLISITLTLHDRRKFALIVGTFLFASGALYFMIMAAWFNAFLFVGYLRPVMIAVGAMALGWGVLSLREFLQSKGKIACQVGDIKGKRMLSKEIDNIIRSPLTLATFAGLVILAFTVNSIEFVCSSAIPAVFTQVLALKNLSALEYYGYIFIYVVMYMLDDIIVFSLAFFAMGGALGDRIAYYGHAVGAVILLGLGLALLFAPHLLMV